MKIQVVLSFCFLVIFSGISAQELEANSEASSPSTERKNGIGIHAGVPGFGMDYGRNLNQAFMLRAQVNYLSLALKDYPYRFSNQDFIINAEIKFVNFDVLMDYHPFKKSSFKMTVGIGYFIDQVVSSTVGLSGNVNFNDLSYTPEQVGMLGISNSWFAFAPYGGVGFGRAVPKRKVGFGIELGTYYVGKPNPTIIATGMLSDNKDNEQQLKENLSEYRWIPVLKMRLSVKI
jgi:hypothetical protein